MKKSIGLYGTVIVAVILGLGLLIYFFDGNGFVGSIRNTAPKSELGSQDQGELIADVTSRKKPELEVTPGKLKVGEIYNLLGSEFMVQAKDADGRSLPVEIVKIIEPDGIESHSDIEFIPEKEGTYTISYRTEEIYQTFLLETIKNYQFIAD